MISSHLYKKIVAAKIFMDENYQEPIRLADVARFACLADYYFLHIFKQVYHITPHQYLMNCRMKKAKELLAESRLPVFEICLQVGYESVTSFCASFKKTISFTPEKYREIFLQKKDQAKSLPLQFIPYCFAEKYGFQ